MKLLNKMLRNSIIILLVLGVVSCKNSSLSKKEKLEYSNKGKEIAQASFKELSGKLMEQMQLGGIEKAIPFCNIEALPLTKEMSEKYNVEIKRTSNKLRNSRNRATDRELEVIQIFEKLMTENERLSPIVELNNNSQKHFYAPIIIKANCLVCHGKVKETVTIKTDSIIKSLYPNDEAIGYNEGDLRGIWSITFKN
ncbi:DUF3365 domain-containing protein [Lutibacter aestuarii]|uniref:DUF3365 domain-containing protein n=1 Tax=Lutibacter aestuarii TaxID=861111 RepID=A0ABW2Z1X7_9FLAO|nr:DUF3365 domain-containing protein [uncultured Lutibacter sp.]